MKKIVLITFVLIFAFGNSVFSEKITVGLIKHEAGSLDEGYVLFSPNYSKTTYLIDKCGYVINKWACNYRPGFSAYLLPDGNLLRTGYLQNKHFAAGGSGGIIEKLDWAGNIIWSYKLSNETECMHHDIKPMPNGNILAICWDIKNETEAIEMGRKPMTIDSCVWGEKVIELRPLGTDSAEIVWEWKVWDHLIQNADQTKLNYDELSKHPELINLNYTLSSVLRDWIHCNSVDYNENLDQILLSAPNFAEVWIIDHSTTKEQAAGHTGGKYGKGGDLLYRWGNPITYETGKVEDQKLFFQHSAYWIPEGFPNENSIRVFNNKRINNDVRFSSVDIFKPPVNSFGSYDNPLPYGPAEPIWTYIAEEPQDFFSSILGSVQQLKNGNVLICDGSGGNLFEINSEKNVVWHYINPVAVAGVTVQGQSPKMENQLFNCIFYPNTYSAFAGKDLTRKGLVENKNSNSDGCTLFSAIEEQNTPKELLVYPNPSDEKLTIETEYLSYTIEINNINGEKILSANNVKTISTKELSNGIYFIYLISDSGDIASKKFIIKR